ncbi:MAG: DHA2 family efflux MFS transporter permease subunit [Chloroflexota bacterium]
MAMSFASGGARRWIFFGLACLCLLMFSIDMTIVSVALRTIVADLDTSLALAAWTLTGFMLTQTTMLPLIGKLGERFGQMRVFIACVFVFTLGSLLCGLAPNIYVLILCRALQALGGAGFMTSATAIVAREFPETRSRMIGLFASILPLGGIVGPNLGGFIIQHYGWREVFLVNVPIGIIAIPLLIWQSRANGLLRAPTRTNSRPLDLAGSGLFAGAIVCVLLALTFLGDDPDLISSPLFWGLFAGGLTFLILFIRHEKRTIEPVIDLSLVTRHPFLVVNLYNFAFGACVFGCFTFIPYYASVQYGMSPLESGAVLTPRSLTMIVMSAVTSIFIIRLGYRIPMVLGMSGMILSMLIIGQGWDQLSLGPLALGPFGILAMTVGLSGIAMGLIMPSSNNAALDLLPERVGVIAGLRQFFRQIGGMIGTAAIVVALSLSPDKAAGIRSIYTTLGLLLIVTIPLAFLIPDSAREKRQSSAAAPAPVPRSERAPA